MDYSPSKAAMKRKEKERGPNSKADPVKSSNGGGDEKSNPNNRKEKEKNEGAEKGEKHQNGATSSCVVSNTKKDDQKGTDGEAQKDDGRVLLGGRARSSASSSVSSFTHSVSEAVPYAERQQRKLEYERSKNNARGKNFSPSSLPPRSDVSSGCTVERMAVLESELQKERQEKESLRKQIATILAVQTKLEEALNVKDKK